jgi:hypothetical protein
MSVSWSPIVRLQIEYRKDNYFKVLPNIFDLLIIIPLSFLNESVTVLFLLGEFNFT